MFVLLVHGVFAVSTRELHVINHETPWPIPATVRPDILTSIKVNDLRIFVGQRSEMLTNSVRQNRQVIVHVHIVLHITTSNFNEFLEFVKTLELNFRYLILRQWPYSILHRHGHKYLCVFQPVTWPGN